MKRQIAVFIVGLIMCLGFFGFYGWTDGFATITGNVITGGVIQEIWQENSSFVNETMNGSLIQNESEISFMEGNESFEINSTNLTVPINESVEVNESWVNGSVEVINNETEEINESEEVENNTVVLNETQEEINETVEIVDSIKEEILEVNETENKTIEKNLENLSENLEPNYQYIVGVKKPSDRKFFGLMKKSEEEVEDDLKANKEKVLTNIKNKSVDLGDALAVTAEDLENIEEYEYIEEVRTLGIALADSTGIIEANESWLLDDFNNINLTGLYETVCIIDTGINFSHPDLFGKNATECNFNCINQACVEDCAIEDLNGHGTHVAGIVGANGGLKGVAPNVSMIGLKVFPGADRSGATTTGIDSAIDWCVSNSGTYNISVISMSLGSDTLYSNYCDGAWSTFASSINAAFNKNISVVVASGNDGSATGISSPACIEKAIPVGSTTKADIISSFSNRNSLVELFATGGESIPGDSCSPLSMTEEICSTDNDGEGYVASPGTSMATPHVAGAIAILNQYFDSISLNKTPFEIEAVLNTTGLQIYDSASDLYYSRINVYDTLLSLDSVSPSVNLVSPTNDGITSTDNVTFVCNATDWQLENITFYLWNSSSLFFNESLNISGDFNETSFEVEMGPFGTYTWNCFYSDSDGNGNFSASNFTLNYGEFQSRLLSPSNGSSTNVNETNFSCRSRTNGEYDLDNVTFYLWNSSEEVYNETVIISGIDNTTIFNYTFLNETNYSWNCLVYDNVSNSTWAEANYSVTYDVTSPNVTLVSPDESFSATGTTSVSFTFTVVDNLGFGECVLILDGSNVKTQEVSNGSNIITYSVSAGSHTWNINCSDAAGNFIIGEAAKTFTISAAVTTNSPGGGGSSGGGGADTTPVENKTSEEDNSTITDSGVKDEENKTQTNETSEETVESSAISEFFSGLNRKKIFGFVVAIVIILGVVIELVRLKKRGAFDKDKNKKSKKSKNGKKSKK